MRLTVTAGAVTRVVATSAGTRAASARRIAAAAPATSASRTVESMRSMAIRPLSSESMKAPGPECVWEAETMSVAGTVPDVARRS